MKFVYDCELTLLIEILEGYNIICWTLLAENVKFNPLTLDVH